MRKKILLLLAVQLFLCAGLAHSFEKSFVPDSAGPALPSDAGKEGVPDESYKMSPGDVLEVTVYREPDLCGEFEVKEDGKITYPLIGSIEVKGLTRSEFEDKITGVLSKGYLVNPYVHISIKTSPSLLLKEKEVKNNTGIGNLGAEANRNITVLGSVAQQGLYNMPQDKNLTILQAIALAGGFTRYASINGTKVIRTNSSGDKVTLYPRVNDAINGKGEDMVLEPGDMIYIPERVF